MFFKNIFKQGYVFYFNYLGCNQNIINESVYLRNSFKTKSITVGTLAALALARKILYKTGTF